MLLLLFYFGLHIAAPAELLVSTWLHLPQSLSPILDSLVWLDHAARTGVWTHDHTAWTIPMLLLLLMLPFLFQAIAAGELSFNLEEQAGDNNRNDSNIDDSVVLSVVRVRTIFFEELLERYICWLLFDEHCKFTFVFLPYSRSCLYYPCLGKEEKCESDPVICAFWEN